MTEPLLRVTGLQVGVTDPDTGSVTPILHGLDFALEQGAITALVGESGSGKTLLMRSILGISDARPGLHAGHAWAQLPAGPVDLLAARSRRRALPAVRPGWASYVFQHPKEALDPWQTVGEQVEASVRVARPKLDRRSRADEVRTWLRDVALDDVDGVAALYPHELSGGMAQRVAVAVALATEPALLVADEPTTGLDWSVRREVIELLLRLQRDRGLTLLLITHDVAVARTMAARILVLFAGRLVEDAPAEAFFRPGPPLHPYAQELTDRVRALELGDPPPPTVSGLPGPLGASCAYAARCARLAAVPSLEKRCRAELPTLRPAAHDHRVACFAVSP